MFQSTQFACDEAGMEYSFADAEKQKELCNAMSDGMNPFGPEVRRLVFKLDGTMIGHDTAHVPCADNRFTYLLT